MGEVIGGTTLIDPQLIFNKARVEEGQTVAELGCGHVGHYVFSLARMIGKNGMLYAVDIQKKILDNISARARVEQLSHIETVWSDLEIYGAARVPAESLHHAFLINTLFQTTQHITVLREAYRLLRHGGHLTVVEWLPSGVPFGPSIERRVRPDALENQANQAGFKTFARFSAGQYHYVLIFEK
ncbi:MAG: class I SAM-dependent methyltransferase [Candidatus Magasanikbacteria bacterium]|nr:class I SAM-dependent methyltransferase [Candidatus Magasanikbacteria bacterium]